jgi:hypothetical protein
MPVSALAVKRPALRPLASLLWHQTEEWVWPGGFLPWINRELLGSDRDEFPIDRRVGFAINVIFGWGSSIAAAAGPRAAAPAAMFYASNVGNVGMHLAWAARHRRYDPGAITAVITLTPVTVIGLIDLANDDRVSRSALVAGIISGSATAVLMPPLLKRRTPPR